VCNWDRQVIHPILMGLLWFIIASSPTMAKGASRDPTEPEQQVSSVQPSFDIKSNAHHLSVTEIFISSNHRRAIINDTLVQEGDKIEDKYVRKIEPYSVSMFGSDGESTLYLLGSDVSVRKESK